MPSPFPGMNPFLEQVDTWEDFHQRFITHAGDALSGQVGENYLVKIEVRLYLHELSTEERRYFGRADIGISLPNVEVEKHASIEIRDRRHRRVVTVIEVLSPTNKRPGPDRDEYLAKRALLLSSPSHLVEIDLRRGGERPEPPRLPACDYYALVSRAQDRPRLGMWPIALRDRLPTIPVPLTPPDGDVSLDLQVLLDHVYDAARYGRYIYNEEPTHP